jgi:hypothetical protein
VFIYGSLKNLVVGPRFKIRTKSEGARQFVAGSFYFGWIEKDLEFARLDNFQFIHHAPLSTVFLYSRNIKNIL